MQDDFGLDLDFPIKRKRKTDAFTPEVEESLLSTLGNRALGGVAAVGNLLDLPGSMVRDTISYASGDSTANPFDQLLDPFGSNNRKTGRDLLRQYGMIGSEDTTGNWWGGLAAEIALDPTTYLSFGASALTKGGQAFRGAGVLDDVTKSFGKGIGKRLGRMTTPFKQGFDVLDDAAKTAVQDYATKAGIDLAQIADEPIQTLARVELPFTNLGFNVGSGTGSQWAAQGLDMLGETAKKSAIGRGARALLDPSVGGKLDYAEQQIAEEAYKQKWKTERAVKQSHVDMLDKMNSGYKALEETYGATGGVAPTYETYDKIVRLAGELNGDVDSAWKAVTDGGSAPTPEIARQVREISDSVRTVNKAVHSSIESKGGRANWIMDREAGDGITSFAHMPRYVDTKPNWADIKSPKTLKTSHAGMQARNEAIRTVPAEIVNRMLVDDTLRGADGITELTTKFGDSLDPEFKVGDEVLGKEGHAKALAQFINEHKAAPLFTRSTADDFLKYQMGAQTVDRSLDAMHEVVSRSMTEGGEGVTVARAFKNAGLTDAAVEHWAKKNGLDAAAAETMSIPVEVANALLSTNKIYEQPEWAKLIGQKIDQWNGWFKTGVTLPFPSFHSRNFTSAQYMNMASGDIHTAADVAAYNSELAGAMKMVFSTGVPADLQKELYVNGVLGKHVKAQDVDIGAVASGAIPGKLGNAVDVMATFRQAKADAIAAPWITDRLPGGLGARSALMTAAGTGGKVAENIEFLNRVPMYLYLRKKGISAEVAAQRVNDLHVDYSNLSPFEKTVMRRLVPFYSFQRRIAPVILQSIYERPGGALAQTIKVSSDLSNADPLTPEHVSSTLAIPNPLKNPTDGSKSYITGFGLPHEQLLQFAGGPQTFLRESASQLSPLFKAPLELASGQSFFQAGPGGAGRPLEELDPTIGRTLGNLSGSDNAVPTPSALEFFFANTPASRVLTTARQLSDPRKNYAEKLINFGTGAKVTDVSVPSQERVVQNQAAELMRSMGARSFSKTYFSPEQEERMTDEQRQQAQALELLQAVLANRAMKRAKDK